MGERYGAAIKLMRHSGRAHMPCSGPLFRVIGSLPVTRLCSVLYLCPTASQRSPPGTPCRAAGVHLQLSVVSFLWSKNCDLKGTKEGFNEQ